MSSPEAVVQSAQIETGLRKNCLSFWEVLGQGIGGIAPSATPAITIPIVVAACGNGTWLVYLFGTVAIIFLSAQINVFAKRSATPGGLYTYITQACGTAAGFISGSGQVFSYLMMACAELCAFALYVNTLIGYAGIQLPQLLLMAIALLTVLYVTFKGVQLSTSVMLTIEAIAVSLIVIMGIIIMIDHHLNFGPQLTLHGVAFQYNTLGLGLVMAFFSFIGFESATAMGTEAKDPLHTIPRAIMGSGIFSGIFFVAMSLIMVMGFMGSSTPLANNASPFTYLANQAHVGIFGILIAIGAIISIWSCTVASIQASARMMLAMSLKRQLPAFVGRTHKTNYTPYVAILICCVVTLLPLLLLLCGNHVIDIYNWTITLCGLGFLVSYILISVGAPVYLAKLKELNTGSVVVAVLALLMLVIPIIGTFYPVPPYPLSLLPYIFLGWLVLSGIWYLIIRKQQITTDQSFS